MSDSHPLCPSCRETVLRALRPLADGLIKFGFLQSIRYAAIQDCIKAVEALPLAAPPVEPFTDVNRMRVQELYDGSAPQPKGGQHVGTQKYQMTPSTRQELGRILRDWPTPPACPMER